VSPDGVILATQALEPPLADAVSSGLYSRLANRADRRLERKQARAGRESELLISGDTS
jgi:hypothetical protein